MLVEIANYGQLGLGIDNSYIDVFTKIYIEEKSVVDKFIIQD